MPSPRFILKPCRVYVGPASHAKATTGLSAATARRRARAYPVMRCRPECIVRALARGGPMFERFTDRARRVVVLAQEEARMLNHNYIGTEHILLGLIHEGEGVAATALESLGISLEADRQQVGEFFGHGRQAPLGDVQ